MIGYVKGNLISAEDGVVILETNGVGFEIACSAAVYRELVSNGGGEVFVYTAVKEDGISLYGFISQEEKKIFLQLISVSGVGPKMGITVLSSLSVNDLRVKIATGDIKGLSAIKGLGKKTAERIILELKEKIGTIGGESATETAIPVMEESVEDDDAIVALMGLGFSRAECITAVKKAKIAGATTIQQTIAFALKSMR